MTGVWLAWLKFGACAAMIGVAGPLLTRYADVIAERTGLSRGWIGLILLATATSLPELFAGLSAVTVAAAPNVAVGNVLGSCLFNLTMLAVVDLVFREEPMYRRLDQGHILTAGFGVVMIGVVGAAILLGREQSLLLPLDLGVSTPLLLVLYLVGVRAVFVYEMRRPQPDGPRGAGGRLSLRAAALRYAAATAVIAAAGLWLPFVAVEIAEVMGWRTTFVGTLFVSAATTLPELVVTLTAVRIGALDMAIANLLGSNLFNVVILAIDDLAYAGRPLLSAVSPSHALSAFAAIIMSGIVIVALLYRPAMRLPGTVGWASLALIALYLLTSYALFLYGE